MANRQKREKAKNEDQTLVLNEEEKRVFVEALLNPPKPNEKLIAAARRYKDEVELTPLSPSPLPKQR